jgi:hypothetical protein
MSRTDPAQLTPEPHPAGRLLDARLHLLDRQVLDADGVPVTAVDDLEFDLPDDDLPPGEHTVHVAALLSGPVLLTRILGGRPPASRWVRISWRHVGEIGTALHLTIRAGGLDATWSERWARDHVIRRIPGGRHDPG